MTKETEKKTVCTGTIWKLRDCRIVKTYEGRQKVSLPQIVSQERNETTVFYTSGSERRRARRSSLVSKERRDLVTVSNVPLPKGSGVGGYNGTYTVSLENLLQKVSGRDSQVFVNGTFGFKS